MYEVKQKDNGKYGVWYSPGSCWFGRYNDNGIWEEYEFDTEEEANGFIEDN